MRKPLVPGSCHYLRPPLRHRVIVHDRHTHSTVQSKFWHPSENAVHFFVRVIEKLKEPAHETAELGK